MPEDRPATDRKEIEVWGNGEQTRSFPCVDDCVEGTLRVVQSEAFEPLILGRVEMVTFRQFVARIIKASG